MKGHGSQPTSTWLSSLASTLWSAVNAGVHGLVTVGVLRPARLGVRVISVGNLQAGGAGKSPLVAQIAREAGSRGLKVCILSRGHGGTWESIGGVIRPDAGRADPALTGDEPALLHELLPGAWFGIGRNRVQAFRDATRVSGEPFDLVILDDGFQHWRVARDLDVLALTSATPRERVFRDWPRAANRARLRIWTKGDLRPPGTDVQIRFRPEVLKGAEFSNKPVWLLTGLGDGRAAVDSIRAEGYRVDQHFSFADHARYSDAQIRSIQAKALEAGAVLGMTGKDWVKVRQLPLNCDALNGDGTTESEIVVFEPRIEFVEGGELWNRVLWDSSS